MSNYSSSQHFQHMPVDALRPYANNPRTHSKKQVRQIADSIEEFGWTNPVLIDADNGVIAGHGRIAAAKLLGMLDVPVMRIDHLTDAQKRAYIIADNKLAENAGWDDQLLSIELQALSDLEINFDIELTGFEMGEIDVLLGADAPAEPEPVPKPDTDTPPVSRSGDLWHIGPHRLYCGDALDPLSWQALLQGVLDVYRAKLKFPDLSRSLAKLSDIAHEVGVSTKTVSMTLRGLKCASLDVTRRIIEVSDRLTQIPLSLHSIDLNGVEKS